MPAFRLRAARRIVAILVVSCAWTTVHGWEGPKRFEGRRLADALRALQAEGLRIVFSSELVTADMRVVTEPRAKNPRGVLDEILRPHGLKAMPGPGAILEIVRARPAAPSHAGSRRPPPPEQGSFETAGEPAYSERVMVTAPMVEGRDRGVASEMVLTRRDLEDLRGTLTDDPIRAAQSLPRAATGDDFRSEFSVRGSPYRHVGVVVDGVATPWLQHAAYGRGDAGSVAMIHTDVLEEATLHAGAYPQRHGDRIGAELGLTLRQGSRSARQFGASVTGTTAALLGEGPLGGSARGSWLVAVRQSFLEWPIKRRHVFDGTVFGFTDAHGKIVYDAAPGQQLTITALAGRSGVDGGDDQPPGTLADGTNRAGLVTVAWRSSVSPRLVLNQQAHAVAHRFQNKYQSGQDAAAGSDAEASYRADVVQTIFGGLLETGAQVRRTRSARQRRVHAASAPDTLLSLSSPGDFSGTSWIRSGYVNFQWSPSARFTITPGLRLTHSTLVSQTPVSRWLAAEWSLHTDWTLNASAGVSHQLPEIEHLLGPAGRPGLVPERATHAEVGIAHRVAPSVRWQASIFSRRERDVLRAPAADAGAGPEPARGIEDRFANALEGSSRGIELVVERRATSGLAGWIAYSYGRSRYTDVLRGDTFWADFDQRHAVNASARYALSARASVAVTFRGGTNFPVSGYLTERDGRLFVGNERNAIRLPGYARLDARAQRTFEYGRSRLTAFVEVLNVLNRRNVGMADGFVQRGSGEAIGFTEPLFPRLPSAGVRIEF